MTSRVFSTVDVAQAFNHLCLDRESAALTTFEMPFGRYRWKRLCFGITPAPEIFQAKMHQVIGGLKGVACIADDMLVYGCGDTDEQALIDHDKKMIALLDRCRFKAIAFTLISHGLSPCFVSWCPIYVVDCRLICSFLLRCRSRSRQRSSRAIIFLSWSMSACSSVSPHP